MGNGVFTIKADQDYFNSVIYIPPKIVKPKIESIDIPDEIKEDSTSSMNVVISNKENSQGIIVVKVISKDLTINPSSLNVELKDEAIVSFSIKTNKNIGGSKVTIEACSIGEFGTQNCDTESKSFSIIKESIFVPEPEIQCGDNICQSSESPTTCSIDCEIDEKDSVAVDKADCKFYENFVESEKEVGTGFLGLGRLVGSTKTITTTQCKTSPAWFLGVFTIIAGLFAVLIALIFKKKWQLFIKEEAGKKNQE